MSGGCGREEINQRVLRELESSAGIVSQHVHYPHSRELPWCGDAGGALPVVVCCVSCSEYVLLLTVCIRCSRYFELRLLLCYS